jgi:hypothetical protein
MSDTMTTQLEANPIRLPAAIDSLLVGLRRRVRAYAAVEGLAVAIVWLAAAFWIGLALDWSLEPDWPIRVAGLAVVAVGVVAIAYHLILRRAARPLSDANMALLLERRYAQFGDRLLTAVELTDSRRPHDDYNVDLLWHTAGQAIDASAAVRLLEVFNRRRLAWRIGIALVCIASIGALAWGAPQAMATWLDRLGGSPEPWPRDTLLHVEGFDTDFAVVMPLAADGSDSKSGPGQVRGEIHVYAGRALIDDPHADEPTTVVSGTAAHFPQASGASETIALRRLDELLPRVPRDRPFVSAEPRQGIVTLRRSHDCLWSTDAPLPITTIPAGTKLNLHRGVAEFLLTNGVVLQVAAPLGLTFAATDRVILESAPGGGIVHARVPARVPRFTLEAGPVRLVSEPRDTLKIVRGGDAQINVAAYADRVLPELVEIRYRAAGGGRGREIMRQDSTAIPGQDEFQRYSHVFKNVLEPVEFEIAGGDERIRRLFVQPVDSPKFIELAAWCEYPAYLVDRTAGSFTPREVTIGGPLEVPQGTRVTLRCTASTPVSAVLVKTADQETPRPIPLSPARDDPRRFELDCGPIAANRVLFFTLVDPDGLANREPIPVELVARPDEPPTAGVRLAGIGSAITANALLPIQGELTDDYGLAKAWFAVQVAEQPPRIQPLAREVRRQRRSRFEATPLPSERKSKGTAPAKAAATPQEALDLKQLRLAGKLALKPNDKLTLSIKAADASNLKPAENVGESDRYQLDVVAPDELRGLLEAREFALRQKFETVIDELQQTRDLLGDVNKGKPSPAARNQPSAADAETTAGVIIERVSQNCERSAYETAQLAAAFEEIRAELWNNRIDAEVQHERLDRQIVVPLWRIADELFPPLESRLRDLRRRITLERQIEQRPPGDEKRAAAEKELRPFAARDVLIRDGQQRIDTILAEMRSVLREMHELEDFNKLLEKLRGLIQKQQQLEQRTIRKQREDLEE